MKQPYDDIIGRIKDPVIWWDVYGAPRYDQPDEDILPFMGRIKCQDCGEEFLVCLVDQVYKGYGGASYILTYDGRCPVDDKAIHAQIGNSSLAHVGRADKHGFISKIEPYNDPLPTGWHYGDPPNHGCVGDTMNSIPEPEWKDYFPQ